MVGVGAILDEPLFRIGTTQTTIGSLLVIIGVALATVPVARLARRAGQAWYLKRNEKDLAGSRTVGAAAQVLVLFLGLEVVLHLLGVHVAAIFAAGGLFALGAGFAVKDILENVLCGWILCIEKTIRSGDLVIIKDEWVIVRHIGMRCTRAQSIDGVEVLIPNSIVAHSMVSNLTRAGRSHRIRARVVVAFDSDPSLVRQTLEHAADGVDWRSAGKPSGVRLLAFEDTGVQYEVDVWIDDAIESECRRSDLHEVIWGALTKQGIRIAHRVPREHQGTAGISPGAPS